MHRARVTGYIPFDGLLQLSLRQSVLSQAFLNVSDVQVGSVVKGTIKALTSNALFVSMSGAVDGVVWPDHYADISLRHPQKRFKVGGPVRCRVLRVDAERRRIVLTAKKTLVDSTLPILAKWEDARVGLVTHAVVRKVGEKSLQVDFYGEVRAVVPFKEARFVVPRLNSYHSHCLPMFLKRDSWKLPCRCIPSGQASQSSHPLCGRRGAPYGSKHPSSFIKSYNCVCRY